jgi:hypothetical protein
VQSLPFLSSILRIREVAITKAALEAALETELDRFEPIRSGSMHYAQLHVPAEAGGWSTIVDWIEILGPKLAALRQQRLIGSAGMDLAIARHAGMASFSIKVPGRAAEAVGRHGVDIEFSVYLTREDQ